MLVLSLPAFENKKYTAYDRFHGNGPYGKLLTKKEPIRTLGFALLYNNLSHFFLSVRQVRRDERKYYEELLQYSKQHLMVSVIMTWVLINYI